MDVERMRQTQLVHDPRQAGDDLARRRFAVAFNGRSQTFGVLPPLPGGDAAGVDRFHPIGFSGAKHPGDDVLCALGFPGFQNIH